MPEDAPQSSLGELDGLRVATAYPVSTRSCLAAHGVEAELISVSGSVEAAPRLGLADAIVDLVSTGSTASANGLRLVGTLLDSQAVLIAGAAALESRRELVERIELMVTGVVEARKRRYLMLNAPRARLERIGELLPGMGAPSVIDLAEPGQIAVHAAVHADEIWDLLAPLQGRRRVVDPRPAGRADGRMRGKRRSRRAPACPRDRDGRAVSAGTRPCSPGRRGSTVSRSRCGSTPERLRAARLAPDALGAVRALADAVAAFSEPQRPPDVAIEAVEGVLSERRWIPLSSVGVYVPGGRARIRPRS